MVSRFILGSILSLLPLLRRSSQIIFFHDSLCFVRIGMDLIGESRKLATSSLACILISVMIRGNLRLEICHA